jgi:hypothetical protein
MEITVDEFKESISDITVATGTFYFNQELVHMTMPTIYYIDTSQATVNIEYFVSIHDVTKVDSNDTCTIITTEYY